MNLFNKIANIIDDSPELKKGEIKQILVQQANEVCPDFLFLDYKNSCYSFQRIKEFRNYKVFEMLHIVFSLKDNFFAVSVASRLNQTYIFDNNYNSGLVNPHKDLITLKTKSSAIPLEKAYYYHNGRVKTIINVVKQIFDDFYKYGIPFIDYQFRRLTENEIIKAGLNFLSGMNLDKQKLQNEIELELRNEECQFSRIKHPIFIQLKKLLQNISGQTKEDRQWIPKTALELLEIYYGQYP